jgi:hypothetical protein
VSKNEIAKRPSSSLKDKGQYAIAFSLIGVMLYVAGFPLFFLLFVGVLTYFVWKIFSSESRNDVRRIFEFYLSANEILRDDYRRWYGFEIQETIARGEKIVRAMPNSPPLVHFSLGALYDRIHDHSSALKHLSYISEDAGSESGIVFPSNELREYVRILRKIERTPAEAPQTSAAIRSLERLRKNRTQSLLENNRSLADNEVIRGNQEDVHELSPDIERSDESTPDTSSNTAMQGGSLFRSTNRIGGRLPQLRSSEESGDSETTVHDRKTISEVLHDIYDKNVQ